MNYLIKMQNEEEILGRKMRQRKRTDLTILQKQ